MPLRLELRDLTKAAILFGALLLVGGCGSDSGRKTVPVSGVVTLGGKPLADADVTFFNEKMSSYGKTDAEGRYTLVQGALPGTMQVAISKVEGEDANTSSDPSEIADDPVQRQVAADARAEISGFPRGSRTGPTELVPSEYSRPETTKLTFLVPDSGTDTADFSL